MNLMHSDEFQATKTLDEMLAQMTPGSRKPNWPVIWVFAFCCGCFCLTLVGAFDVARAVVRAFSP
jgi:hypothetical protein